MHIGIAIRATEPGVFLKLVFDFRLFRILFYHNFFVTVA